MLNNILEPFTNPGDINIHHGTFSIDLVMLLVLSLFHMYFIIYVY